MMITTCLPFVDLDAGSGRWSMTTPSWAGSVTSGLAPTGDQPGGLELRDARRAGSGPTTSGTLDLLGSRSRP